MAPKQRYLPAILQILREQPGALTDRQIFYRLVNHWIGQHGDMVYELDALEPAALLQIVEESIKAHFNLDKFKKRNEYIETGRQELARLTNEYFGEA